MPLMLSGKPFRAKGKKMTMYRCVQKQLTGAKSGIPDHTETQDTNERMASASLIAI